MKALVEAERALLVDLELIAQAELASIGRKGMKDAIVADRMPWMAEQSAQRYREKRVQRRRGEEKELYQKISRPPA